MIRNSLQPFYTTWVLLTFTISILVCFPVFVILSIGSGQKGRRAIFKLIRGWAGFWLWLIGMPVKTIGNVPSDGKFIIVANHISYIDTLVIFPAIRGYFRPLGKKEISKIPVVGFIYKQIVIMVDRSSVHSRARSMRLLWRVLHHEGSIIIFPEGTFNETGKPLKDFYDGAFRLALNTHIPILPVLLPDTIKRWHYSGWWKLWPGCNRVVFLDPVPVSELTMADMPGLKQKVYNLMETSLKEYNPYE